MPPRPAPKLPTLIEQLSPDVVLGWLPPDVVDGARTDVELGRVAKPAVRSTSIHAIVADARLGRARVRIAWSADAPVSSCECGATGATPCRHAAAVALLLIGGALPGAALGPAPDDAEPAASRADDERRIRAERGASELFHVEPYRGTRTYGRYAVSSPSSRAYDVVLRSFEAPENGCTCPDFAVNLLGTCKHIEAALHHVRRASARAVARATKVGPAASYLCLVFDPDPALKLCLAPSATPRERRVRSRWFDAGGALRGPLVEAWADLERDALDAGIEVPREVQAFALRALESHERHRRQRETERTIRAAGEHQPGFRAKLYPYQVDGVAFLTSRRRALLADDMGLGKTAQAIAAMAGLMRSGEVRRTLIVCPASLKHQWQREIERFTGLGEGRVAVVSGPREVRRERYASEADVLVTSYELVRTDEEDLALLAPDLLILDEAQRIKNWRTQTATSVKRIPSRLAFVLTGTPLENRLDDLYSLMQVIDPHLFGPLWRFNEDFTRLDERGKVLGYTNLDRLRARLSNVLLRRRKEDVLTQLPAQLVNRLSVPMTDEQTALHDDAQTASAQLLARLKKRPLTPMEERRLVRAFQRMRMSCDAAGLVDKETVGAPKLDELERLLEEICVDGGHKVVVFSEWETMQAMAAEVCKKLKLGHVRLHGGVPTDARGALIDRFREDPRCKVFLSTDAGGVGLNLQVASHLVNLDLPWNPAVLAQRIARVHRLGQSQPVNVVLMVSAGSFEERLEVTLSDKRALFAAVVGDDAETTELARSTLASRVATLLGSAFAATTGRTPTLEDQARDPVASLRERFGDTLEQVVRLADGKVLAVVRGGDAGRLEGAAEPSGALILPSHAAAALASLGGASPLAGAEIVFHAEVDPAVAAKKALVAAAERKLTGAHALVAAGLGGEALALARDAMMLACRALDERGDPGDDPAALTTAVYAHLVPSGALSAIEAAALGKADQLARAFGGAAASQPPPELVNGAVGDAAGLVGRVKGTVALRDAISSPAPLTDEQTAP